MKTKLSILKKTTAKQAINKLTNYINRLLIPC